jgi:hypothetical protein
LVNRFRDYYEIVKNPISLAEIDEKVNRGSYDSMDDFEVHALQ